MRNWKDYDVYIFDFDGTISDTGAGIIHALKKTLQEFNISVTDEQLRPFIGPPLGESLRGHLVITDDRMIQDIIKQYRHLYYEGGHVDWSEMYAGMKDLLEGLYKKGKKLAVASMKPVRGLDYLCEKYGIKEYFAAICGPDQNEWPATKDGVIDLVFEKLPKDNSVMVGDSAFDVYGAHVHQIPCIAVHYGFGTPESLAEAEGHAMTVKELSQLIL